MATCVCVLIGEGNNSASGTLRLSQASEDAPTKVEGTVRGLTPGSKHGISICIWGDLTDGGNSCGNIFNPFGRSHTVESHTNRIENMLRFRNLTTWRQPLPRCGAYNISFALFSISV